ncbi:hypothetical protein J4438_03820 [Candidatus Woesearchaeota archaeon]|nr:hypothetical protein [Candidatus Woesearchaeota archaeon]
MKKNIKIVTTLMLLLITLFTSAYAVSAADEQFEITKVTIEDVEFEGSDLIDGVYAPVHLGEKLDIKVEWEGISDFSIETDAEITVDGDALKDDVTSDEFQIYDNWHGSETISVEIDNDEDLLEDDMHLLEITLELDNGEERTVTIELDVSRSRNEVQIYDVNFGRGLQTEAGKLLTASVGVSNEGNEDEEDIYVVMSIPELGLMTRSDRFDLVTQDFEDSDDADDDDYSKLHKELSLDVPASTKSGVYDLHFEVFYNDGDDKDEQVYSLVVGAGSIEDSEISIDTTSQTVEAGKAIVYKITFGNENVDYNVKVTGLDFGTYEVREENDVAYVFVSTKEDAKEGSYDFEISVEAGNEELKTFDVTTNVVKAETNVNYSDVRQGLEIGFAVLLIILVILGIVLIAKRLGKGNEVEEPAVDEDQTYY